MKVFQRVLAGVTALSLALSVVGPIPTVSAATTPSLGAVSSFGVLAQTYNRNGNPGPVITGDFGYATLIGSSSMPTVSGATHVSDSTYVQAGADQNTALASLNSQPCTFTFPAGPINLATDTTHGALGVYTPGVYCVTSMVTSVTIGAAGITLSGNGTYIFRFNGSLNTAANSVVTLSNGASACDVFWTPVDNAISSTFGFSSTFVGTVIDNQGFSVHDSVTWLGRALAFQGAISVASNVAITTPSACTPPPPTTATLRVIKHVVNNNGGIATASSFNLHVKGATGGGMADVAGSPAAGVETPGTPYTLNAGTYVVSEDAFSGYTSRFSGDCNSGGSITLASGENKTCTITNDDIAPPTPGTATLHVIKNVINNNGGTATSSSFNLHVKGSGSMGVSDVVGSPAVGVGAPGTSYTLNAGTYSVSEDVNASYTSSFSGDCNSGGSITLASGENKTCTITNDDIETPQISTSGSATLHVIKTVINDNNGTAVAADAVIHVTTSMGDVAGSPKSGAVAPGNFYTLIPGTYNVSENFFSGYTVTVSGDCSANGNVVLVNGDNKTCTITNNDIAVLPPSTVTPPTSTPPVPVTCDICARLTYDVYIINPDLSERHTGTAWVKVTDRGNKVKRYSFEDATLDSHNPLFDHNDSVIDVDYTDCKSVKFMFISSDASWKHQVKIIVSIDGVQQSDTLVAIDSKAVVGTSRTVNATTGVNTQTACLTAPAALKGKILLQVQQHGEAWYVRPSNGLRYYMKDGPVAYGMMRNFGLGITDKDLALIPSVQTIDELKNSTSVCSTNAVAKRVKGNILLQVQQHGEAWYVDTTKCRRIYMKDGAAAYSLMRFLGLGITDADLAKLPIGQ